MPAVANTPSVLVVDAEPYICRVIDARLTKDSNFVVTCSSSGTEALQAVFRQAYDVILWDLRLFDNEEHLPRVRALCPSAGLILMTTDDRFALHPGLSYLDIAAILNKPFGLDNLVATINRVLLGPQAMKGVRRLEMNHIGREVELISPNGRCMTRIYASGQDTFEVVGPPRVKFPEDCVPGASIQVVLQGDQAVFTFASQLLRSIASPAPRWELALPATIRREQRRRYLRFPLPRVAVHLELPATEAGTARSLTDLSVDETAQSEIAQTKTAASTSKPEGIAKPADRVQTQTDPTETKSGDTEPTPDLAIVQSAKAAEPTLLKASLPDTTIPDAVATAADFSTANKSEARLENVALGGCAIVGSERFASDVTVRLFLNDPRYPDSLPVGRVVRVEPASDVLQHKGGAQQYRIGVEFIDPSAAECDKLLLLIADLEE